jgi:hypothetical protein
MLDVVHLHIAINHSPLYAEMFAFLLLIAGFLWRKQDFVTAGLYLAIFGGLSAIAAFMTGDQASDLIRHGPPIAGLDTNLIGEHDQAAGFFLTAACITGGLAIISLIITRRRGQALGWLDKLIAVALLLSFSIAGRTALLGGRIHHPEIRPGAEIRR